MGERIKKARKALDLTQQAFADRLGMKQNTVATYEMGRTNPSDPAIKSICREFGISETWLRTGEGEMFIPITRDEQIAAFVGDALATESDTFKKRFISMLSRLKESDWEVLERMVDEMKKD